MSQNKSLSYVLKQGKLRLKTAEKENFAWEASQFMMKVLNCSKVELMMREENFLLEVEIENFNGYIEERIKNRPFQYIMEECEFMGLPFFVGEGVLIPRADTEILVEIILEIAKKNALVTVLDIGTGSGCIPISLEQYGGMIGTGVDISPKALHFAKKNGERNERSVQWYLGDLFAPLPKETQGLWDCIVSNPPYIQKEIVEGLMEEVKDFEPRNALDGGEDGLDFYRKIVEESPSWLKNNGWLFFEIGYDQGEAILSLMKKVGFCQCTLKQDLAGLDRVVYGKLEK